MDELEREEYLLFSRLPAHKKKVSRSLEIIKEALQQIKNRYAAISFGKDSMILLHLLTQECPGIPMVWSDRGEEAELPATYPFVEQVKQKYNINLQIIRPEMNMFEIYEEYGLPEIDDGVTKSIVKEINLVQCFDKFAKENNIDGYFQGLRADEARGRRWFTKKYGPIHHRKDGLTVCNPLLWWTARDIWAYTVANKIPYHPEYDNTRFKSREQIRLSNWSGLYWAQEGRLQELKYYHPELFEKLANRFPAVKSLV